MKNLKKLLAMVLALMLVFSLAVTAMAADETYTLTINNKAEGHTYEAYQIFKGKLSNAANPDDEDGTSAELSDIQWGDSVTYIGAWAFSDCDSLTTIIVDRNSYARQYCIDNGLPYTYSDANDWLLN